MASVIATQPIVSPGAPRRIIDQPLLAVSGGSRVWDVAPAGRILAIKEDDSVRSDHIVVVQNWLSEAHARLSSR